jgi:hypothetical protein
MAKEPPVSAVVRELYHYTSIKGLKGILAGQYLRATRSDHLNDSTEVRHFRDDLIAAVRELLSQNTRKLAREDGRFRTNVARAGGARFVAHNDAINLVRRFFQVTFEGDEHAPAFAVPFVTSFCSHHTNDKYTQRNGLLSQWRAYGTPDGRFALVFDVKKLEILLGEEVGKYLYSFANISDVVYNTETLDFKDRFSDLLQLLALDWAKHALGKGPGAPDDIFNEFIKCAVRFKHQAFSEEQEYRIVACPMSFELDNFFKEMGAASPTGLPVKSVEADERARPYIPLFKNASRPLPIKRIIIGPHPNQAGFAPEAQDIVKGSIPIYASETPYIG